MSMREPRPPEAPSPPPAGSPAGSVVEPGVYAWVRRVLVAVGIGRGPKPPAAPPPTDRGTVLAEERTQLAFERSFLAAERTLMAWIRTSMAMISFGFTMVKFLEYLEQERKLRLSGPLGHSFGVESLGLAFITIGTLSLVAAVLQHRRTLSMLHARGLESGFSLALTVASFVAVLGVFAFGSLVLKF